MIKNVRPKEAIGHIARLFNLQPRTKNAGGSFFIKSTGEFFISKDDMSYNDVLAKLGQYFRHRQIVHGSINIDPGCVLYTTFQIKSK